MTPEERKRQQHLYVRQLLDAVNAPAIEKQRRITETRRRNRLKKKQKAQEPATPSK